jgi:hypothetical protein
MSSVFEVWLDEERQIIQQRMNGEPNLAQFLQMIDETRNCVERLRCPTDVRILVDGVWFGRMHKPVRAHAAAQLRRSELRRMAIVNPPRVARILMRFIAVASGVDKARTFPDEAEALRWLLS